MGIKKGEKIVNISSKQKKQIFSLIIPIIWHVFLTSIIAIILYSSEYSLRSLGLLICSVWAVPFTISYIKTNNIYIPMKAHFICNLTMNGLTCNFRCYKTIVKIL
jgi:membrane protease YdiL (CAAX protease family)